MVKSKESPVGLHKLDDQSMKDADRQSLQGYKQLTYDMLQQAVT
jgi:hypothetical protein